MERDDGGGGGKGEICVLFHCSLWSLDILGEVREMVELVFRFCSFPGFCFSLWFLQTDFSILAYFLSPSRSLPLLRLPFSLVSAPRWKLSSVALLPLWKMNSSKSALRWIYAMRFASKLKYGCYLFAFRWMDLLFISLEHTFPNR